MELKKFRAGTLYEAMELAEAELGEDVVIVSSGPTRDGSGFEITVSTAPVAEKKKAPDDTGQLLAKKFDQHNLPMALAAKLLKKALSLDEATPLRSLAGAFDSLFFFAPLTQKITKPLMVVGPPGAGKSVCLAKLAARARFQNLAVNMINLDTIRSGAAAQIQTYADALKVNLFTADSPHALERALDKCAPNSLTLIDTTGVNPFSHQEMEDLRGRILVAKAEPILVLPAAMDTVESEDIGEIFAQIGVQRFLITKLDMARHYGSLLTLADASKCAFSDVSFGPKILDGLSSINAMSLARLFLPDEA